MPPPADAALQELRLRYQAAYTAYQACARAVAEATMSGELPSPTLLATAAKALDALSETRTHLLAAIAAGADAAEPPGAAPR
jgi:hypothetical protein